MAHFAKLDANNLVLDVIVVDNKDCLDANGNESEQQGISFLKKLIPDSSFTWVQTSYNSNFRKHYASIGATYDVDRDAFIRPKPHESWILNESTCLWEAPVPLPDYDKLYEWNEQILNWVEVVK